MVKIETLEITVTYKVGLSGINLKKNIIAQLEKACKDGKTLDLGGGLTDKKYQLASNWIRNNIDERDGYSWEAIIDEITF